MFSLLDGLSNPVELAKKVKENKQKYVGITDHSSIDGVIAFQKACKEESISPVIGCEGYIVPDWETKNKSAHITFLVKNDQGWNNLCSLLTYANLDGFYRKPRMNYDLVLKYCEGLIVMTGCANSFLHLPGGVKFFYNLAKEAEVYLEIMPHNLPEQKKTNDLCFKIHQDSGIGLVATYDSHYVNKEDSKAQEVLLAIQRKAKWNDPNRWKFDIDNLYLCSGETYLNMFQENYSFPEKQIKEAMNNTIRIAQRCCSFEIKQKHIHLPSSKPYPDKTKDFNIRKICLDGYKEIFGRSISSDDVYWKRFKKEFAVIKKLNLADYFLVVYDLLNWCRRNNILIGPGRGSSSGSLIAYLMKITTVDPIPNYLIFERFLNVDRSDMADIDIDIPDIDRDRVRDYLINKYGKNNISGVSTFMRMKSKGVLRDVSRVFDVPLAEVLVVSKAIQNEWGIKEVLTVDEGINFQAKYPEVVKISQRLENIIRGASQHASAVIVSEQDLSKSGQCNLVRRKGKIIVNWEKEDAEFQGLLKLDLLGLNQLTIIRECVSLIEDEIEDLNYIKPVDDRVFEMISQGETAGIFQMNTPHITKFVKDMGVESFEHMTDVIALVRPGPLESGMAEEYIARKHGKKWDKLHPIYENITKRSYGQAIMQEDLMFVITEMAGLPFTVADKIRKIIGKKRDVSEMLPFKKMFVDGCIKEKTFSKQEAEDFWHVLESAAGYLFNRSHSVAYAHIGYQTGWLKLHYPLEFLCANMTYGKEDKKDHLIQWGKEQGIKINLPKIGKSDALKWKIKEGALFAPFIEIKGFGEVSAIKAAKKNRVRQTSFFDLKRVDDTQFDNILNSIGAYEDKTPTTAQSYFSFCIR